MSDLSWIGEMVDEVCQTCPQHKPCLLPIDKARCKMFGAEARITRTVEARANVEGRRILALA